MPVLDNTEHYRPHRAIWPAMKKGLACKCPNCGEGKMFRAYLKVADTCPNCGEELHHHRADDAPPYLVIVIVGHLLVGIFLHIEMVHSLHPMIYIWTMIPATIVLSLLLLPVVKGAVVGLQWAKYMHGFDPNGPDDEFDYDTRG